MLRYSRSEVVRDYEDMNDAPYDASEFSTHRSDSLNTFSDITFHHSNSTSSPRHFHRSRQPAYDNTAILREALTRTESQEHLRRQLTRYQLGEFGISRSDPRTRLSQDESDRVLGQNHRMRVADESYSRGEYQHERVGVVFEYEIQQMLLEQEQEEARSHHHHTDRESYDGRRRRNAVTAYNDEEYLAQLQGQREQQERRYQETPVHVRKHGRGYFPSYDYR